MLQSRIDNLNRLWGKTDYYASYELIPDAPRLLNWDRGECARVHPTLDGQLYDVKNNQCLDFGDLRFIRFTRSFKIDEDKYLVLTEEGQLCEISLKDKRVTLIKKGVEFICNVRYRRDKSMTIFLTRRGWHKLKGNKIDKIRGDYIPGIVDYHDKILTAAEGYYTIEYDGYSQVDINKVNPPEDIISIVGYNKFFGIRLLALTSDNRLLERKNKDHQFTEVKNLLVEMLSCLSSWKSLQIEERYYDNGDPEVIIINEAGQEFKIVEDGLISQTYCQEVMRTYKCGLKNPHTRI